MVALMAGTLEWTDEEHDIPNCTSAARVRSARRDPSGPDEEGQVSLFRFYRRECTKVSGPGVTSSRQQRVEFRNDMAANLAVGDWVMFEGNQQESSEPIWLGRILSNPEWGGRGVCKNETKKSIKYPSSRVTVGQNEVAMNVMWYERIDISSEELDYHISRDISEPVVQNNRCLVHAGFNMHRMNGRSNPVPKQRTSNREAGGAYSTAKRGNQTSFHDWHEKEFSLEWKMDKVDRDSALSRLTSE